MVPMLLLSSSIHIGFKGFTLGVARKVNSQIAQQWAGVVGQSIRMLSPYGWRYFQVVNNCSFMVLSRFSSSVLPLPVSPTQNNKSVWISEELEAAKPTHDLYPCQRFGVIPSEVEKPCHAEPT